MTFLQHFLIFVTICQKTESLTPFQILTSDTENLAYDSIVVSDQSPARNIRLRSGLIPISWIKTRETNMSFMYNSSRTIQQMLEIWPRNESQFFKTMEEVRFVLDNVVHWKSWSPIIFVHWPGDDKRSRWSEVKVPFSLNSDVFIFSATESLLLNVHEMYVLGKNYYWPKFVVKQMNGMSFSNFLNKAVRRQNLWQNIIRPVAYEDPNTIRQVTLTRTADGKLTLGRGVCPVLFKTLQYALNFSIEVVAGRGIIRQDENGSWIGMGAQMRNNEADITINLSPLLAYRIIALDLLHSFAQVNIQAFFKHPQACTFRNILVTPLSSDTWFSLLSMWTLIVTSLTCIHLLRVHWLKVRSSDNEMVEASVLWVISTFCQQGWYTTPTSRTLKVIFLTTTVLGYIAYIAFSAALVRILYIDPIPLDSKEELVRSGFRILGDMYIPHVEKTVEELESLGQNHRVESSGQNHTKEHLVRIEAAIPEVVSGKAVFVGASDGFFTVFERLGYTSQEYCNEYGSISLGYYMVGFYVRKASEYREVFNQKILMMNERGVTRRHIDRYLRLTLPQCPTETTGRGGEPLGMSDVASGFFILIGGILLSLIQYVLEVFVDKVRVLKRQKGEQTSYLN